MRAGRAAVIGSTALRDLRIAATLAHVLPVRVRVLGRIAAEELAAAV